MKTAPVRTAAVLVAALMGSVTRAQDSEEAEEPKCPGSFDLKGYGQVEIVPTGWKDIEVLDRYVLNTKMDARAYFADKCTAGEYSNEHYLALNLLGKSMSFTADVSGAGCGCNAAFYLTSMHQNTEKSECQDYYCDANAVCGVSCSEIDIMEGNMHAFHSTLHSAHDHDGKAAGYGGGSDAGYAGWSGPRDWNATQYGPEGKCINTHKPFQVSVDFPTNGAGDLEAMTVMLTQDGSSCPLAVTITDYNGNAELTSSLSQGMTPIFSYWKDEGMLWLDGEGADQKGPCRRDHPNSCAESVRFYDFAIEKIGGGEVTKEDLRGNRVELVPQADAPAPAGGNPWWSPPETTAPAPAGGNPWWSPSETTAQTTTAAAWWVAPETTAETTTTVASTQAPTPTPAPVRYSWNGYKQVQGCDCGWLNQDDCKDTSDCAVRCRAANEDPGKCDSKAASASLDAAAEKTAEKVQEEREEETERLRLQAELRAQKKKGDEEKAKAAKVKAAALQAALEKAEHEQRPSLTENTCFREGGEYAPVNMPGSSRSMEVDAQACQARCAITLGCARFTYWHEDGGCHLQDSDSEYVPGAGHGVISGPASCKADAYCHAYINEQGCGWTVNHNCYGQMPGKIGYAHDDGSRGFECCCKYEMWKNDKDASKHGVPAVVEDKEAQILCTASAGSEIGDPMCCGQMGIVSQKSHICPEDRPTCVGLVAHTTWGTCQVAQDYQQCGGKKDGEDWWGPTTCNDGFECKAWSQDYSQCIKAESTVIMMKDQLVKIKGVLGSRLLNALPTALVVVAVSISLVALYGATLRSRRTSGVRDEEISGLEAVLRTGGSVDDTRTMVRSRPSADHLLESAFEFAV